MSKQIGGGRFDLLRRMGAGGMGVVYEAIDHERDLRVALKKLNRADGHTLYRFKKEFRSLLDLDHPNLVRLGELFEDGSDWFFTMELVEGVDILSWVRPGGTLDVARARPAFAQLAQGLAALHVAGKVHRDVKPANVLVTADGRVVLVDFGLVWDATASRDASALTVVGTAAYMAPEQAASRPLSPAADWYAVGALLYEALTARPPYKGNLLEIFTAKQVEPPPPPRELAADAPEDLSQLSLDLMRFAPTDRPSAGEVLERLGARAAASTPSFQRTMSEAAPFVGRGDELRELEAAYDRAVAGVATRVFVVGESGVGKTRLLTELTVRLRARDAAALVLRGRCYERESVHYKAFDGVIDALSRHLQRLGDDDVRELMPEGVELLPLVFPVLGRIAGIGRRRHAIRGVRDPIALRTRVFGVLRALFARLAERHPVVIAIDDYQWADADSELLMSELLHQPGAPPLLVVATSRVTPELADTAVVEVGALPDDFARELAEVLLERLGSTRGDAVAIASECGGHPLFIDEMVRHAALEAHEHTRALRLDDTIRARVAALSEPAARTLEVICAAATSLDHGLIMRAAGVEPRDLERAISQLRVARMVRAPSPGKLEPYHDRIREATIDHMAASRLRGIHGRLAAAIEQSDLAHERPELLVEHLAAAGDPAAAASYAERAAERAADVFAFERAAELYRIALEHGEPDADERRALQRSLADALANAGRGRDAAPLYLSAAIGAEPNARVECQRLAARHLLLNGHFEQGTSALEETLAEQGLHLPGGPRSALASLLWQRLLVRVRGTRWRERLPREIADADLARVDVMLDVGEAMGMFDTVAGADFQMRGLRRALRLGEPTRVARALGVEGIYVASQGRKKLARARALADEMSRIAERSRDPFLDALSHTVSGIVAYLGGELVEAAEILRDTEERYHELGSRWELNNARLFRMFATRWTGGFERRHSELRELTGDAHRRGDLYTETALRLTCNMVHLARDAPDDAELDLDAVSWRPPGGGFHLQNWWELEARTELALYNGADAAAFDALAPSFRELDRSLLTRIQFVRANSRWTWGRLCAATGHTAEVERAAARLARERVGYATVWSELLRASVAEAGAAAHLLDTAHAHARLRGMPLLTAVARRRRAELIGDDEERQVADAWLREEGVVDPARFAGVFV